MSFAGDSDDYAFVAEFYDHFPPYKNRPDVSFFVEAATRSKGPILEVGSGTGRILIPTARAGIAITGLDGSRCMLKVCRQNILLEPEQVV